MQLQWDNEGSNLTLGRSFKIGFLTVRVAHPYNPNNQEAEAGGSQNRDMPGVDRIVKVSLNSKGLAKPKR